MTSNKVLIPDDYQDYLYRLTYWLLGKVAHLIPKSISPNQITMVAFFSAMLGTYLLYVVKSPAAYLYWIIFNFAWYILDALDGIHARLSDQCSEFGAFLDHALDDIYFLFMLTIFAIKFDLMQPLYIYILLLRVTTALLVFTVQYHTKRLYLPKFSGGVELILFTAVMFLNYFYPNYNPLHHITNPMITYWIHLLNLQTGTFMKLCLLLYFIGAPIAIAQQFLFVKKNAAN